MNEAVLLLAATSVPMGLYGLLEFADRRSVRGLFGMIAAGWSVSGVVLVSLGVPGILFFPGLLAIVIFGSVVQLRVDRRRLLLTKAVLAAVALGLVSIGMVFL